MTYKLINYVIQNKRFFVYKIIDMSFEKRQFMFTNKNLPYVLSLNYREFNHKSGVSPIAGISPGFLFHEELSFSKKYDFYLESSDECQHHIDEINKRKKMIDDIFEKYKANY